MRLFYVNNSKISKKINTINTIIFAVNKIVSKER